MFYQTTSNMSTIHSWFLHLFISKTWPSGFCLYPKGLDGTNKLYNPIVYTKQIDDEDISEIFVKKLEAITNKIYSDYYKKPKPLKLTSQEEKEFHQAEIRHICEKEFYEDITETRPLKNVARENWGTH